MNDTVKIVCENTGRSLFVEMGTSLDEVIQMISLKNKLPFLAAYVNNEVKELGYRIFDPVSVRFIDITHFEGMRVYERTLVFILHKATTDLYPERRLLVKYSVAKGFYAELDGGEPPTEEEVEAIQVRMDELIAQNIPIVWEKLLYTEAEEISREFGFNDKMQLLETRPSLYVKLYRLADLPGYFYGALAPSTGFIHLFDLRKYYNGFYIGKPRRTEPDRLEDMISQDKMFDIFQEYKEWVSVLGVATVGAVNAKMLSSEQSDIIKIAEAFHEKKVASIADSISERQRAGGGKLVLISGPSSSGKTTFSKRLSIQLRVLGYHPVMISMDNYFIDRDKTPLDEDGEHDFEALEALDVALFNQQLLALLDGQEVSVPRYDFLTGKSVPDAFRLKLPERSVLIVEGIHGLNPALTAEVPDDQKYKIYISALTSISIDNLTRVPTTDNRLIRRIVRDYEHRAHTAEATIRRWQSVRRGEDKHVFPYQEQADVMFNSALMFELCVLKDLAEPLLHEVQDIVPEYGEAQRLLRLLNLFVPISSAELPPTSILREFIGGSSFKED
jgi:uridine kinase